MNERQVVARGLLVSGRNASVVFNSVHKPLDEVSAFVDAFAKASSCRAVAARRDDNFRTALADGGNQLIRVIAFIGDHGVRFVLGQQFFGPRNVMLLARAQAQLQRLALSVYRQVQFAAESAAGTAERVFAGLFFWEPAAC